MFIGLIRHNIHPPQSSCVHIDVGVLDIDLFVEEYESFTVYSYVTAGSSPISYQWQVNYPEGGGWQNILGATSDTYTEVTGLELYQSGTQYRCNISNACSSATSAITTIEIIGLPPP